MVGINGIKDFSTDTRKLEGLWEDHWQEEMHERQQVLKHVFEIRWETYLSDLAGIGIGS